MGPRNQSLLLRTCDAAMRAEQSVNRKRRLNRRRWSPRQPCSRDSGEPCPDTGEGVRDRGPARPETLMVGTPPLGEVQGSAMAGLTAGLRREGDWMEAVCGGVTGRSLCLV